MLTSGIVWVPRFANGVSEVRARPEARPFFADYVVEESLAEVEAPQSAAVGYWRPRTDSGALGQHS